MLVEFIEFKFETELTSIIAENSSASIARLEFDLASGGASPHRAFSSICAALRPQNNDECQIDQIDRPQISPLTETANALECTRMIDAVRLA